MTMGKLLRENMQKGPVTAPFIVDGMQAILAKEGGFGAAYMTGFGIASTYGLPDVGLITLTQMAEKIRTIASAVDIPLIADGDTGYGNYVNVMQTVREYERAGAAALHLEDQLWPKRCGFMAGKQVIDKAEAVSKIRAAVDARKNEDFVIIARSDALAVNGWDDVEDRLRSYVEAGADMVFVDGVKTEADMEEYARRMGDLPAIFNNVPRLAMSRIQAHDCFKVIINPVAMAAAWTAYSKALETMLDDVEAQTEMDSSVFGRIVTLLGAPKYFALDKKYGKQE